MNIAPSRLNYLFIRSGFSLIELLLGLAIVVILAVLINSGFAKIQSLSSSAKCINNLRQIGAAFQLYAAENNNTLPPGNPVSFPQIRWRGRWYDPKLLNIEYSPAAYAGGLEAWKKITVCPENIIGDELFPYCVNYNLMAPAGIDKPFTSLTAQWPSRIVLLIDSSEKDKWGMGLWGPHSGWNRVGTPHGKRSNVLWADMHISTVDKDKLKTENFIPQK